MGLRSMIGSTWGFPITMGLLAGATGGSLGAKPEHSGRGAGAGAVAGLGAGLGGAAVFNSKPFHRLAHAASFKRPNVLKGHMLMALLLSGLGSYGAGHLAGKYTTKYIERKANGLSNAKT